MDPESWRKIQSVYGSVDEIDLFVGGLAELPTQGDNIILKHKEYRIQGGGDRFSVHFAVTFLDR